jgi:hypothetical protein
MRTISAVALGLAAAVSVATPAGAAPSGDSVSCTVIFGTSCTTAPLPANSDHRIAIVSETYSTATFELIDAATNRVVYRRVARGGWSTDDHLVDGVTGSFVCRVTKAVVDSRCTLTN